MKKHYNTTKELGLKNKVKKILKWMFSTEGATLITAFLSFIVACLTLGIAKTTYDYATLDFTLLPKFEISDGYMTITNPYTDIFRITDIDVKEYEEYRILDNNIYLFNTLVFNRDRRDDDTPDLNKVSINLNEPYQSNGKIKNMEDFKKIYQDKILYLKGEVKTEYEQTFYLANIDYVNLKNYQHGELELEIFVNEKNEITHIDPLAERITRFNSFDFVDEYVNDDFGGEWQFFMQFLENAKERATRD